MNGVGLLIYYGCIGLTDLFGLTGRLWYNVAIVVGTILGTLFRFFSYSKWVWPHAPVLEASDPIEEQAQDLAAMVGAAPVSHGPVGSATANGASTNGASADGALAGNAHTHARPGRATFRHTPGDGDQRPDGRAPASHRRTS